MLLCNCACVAMAKIAHTCDLIYVYRCLHCTACNKQLYRLSPAFLLSCMTVLYNMYWMKSGHGQGYMYIGAMDMLWASGHLMVMWSLHGVLGQRKDWVVSSLCVWGVCVCIHPVFHFILGTCSLQKSARRAIVGSNAEQLIMKSHTIRMTPTWCCQHTIAHSSCNRPQMSLFQTLRLYWLHTQHCLQPLLLLAVEWLQPVGSYFLPKGAFDCRTVSFVISIPIEFKIYSDRVTRIWRWEYAP